MDINLSDGQTHEVTLYSTNPGTTQRFDIFSASTGALLDTQTLAGTSGEYISWDLKGNLIIRVTNLGPDVNENINAIFFGGPATTTTHLYYSAAGQVLEERTNGTAAADVSHQYVWSEAYVNALVLRDDYQDGTLVPADRRYVQQDANYDTTALVNTSGAVVERYVYSPYGAVTVLDASGTPVAGDTSAYGWQYLFQGGRQDAVTGDVQFNNRDYRPSLGVWTQADPLGLAAGDLNDYGFVGGNPVNATDPSGLAERVRVAGMSQRHDRRVPGGDVGEVDPKVVQFLAGATQVTGGLAGLGPSFGASLYFVGRGIDNMQAAARGQETVVYQGLQGVGLPAPLARVGEIVADAPDAAVGTAKGFVIGASSLVRPGSGIILEEGKVLAETAKAVAKGVSENPGQSAAAAASAVARAEAVAAEVAAAENAGATFGSATSTDYSTTFFAANPELEGQVVVHHAVEQQVLKKFPGVVSEAEMHSLENLRGIPLEINSDVHLSKIRIEWNRFYKLFIGSGTAPTKAELLQKATEIDAKFGAQFKPPVGGGE
jgi:RHS repeat-associated protein